MQEEFDTVILEYDEDTKVANITLNRPDRLNALNAQLDADIRAAFDTLYDVEDEAANAEVRVVVIEGAGDQAFCAGADIGGFEDRHIAEFETHTRQDVIEEFPAPVIAKIDGYALGGGLELACSCDFRLASESSAVGLPEVDLGILPGAGGVQYLARLTNYAKAKEIAMTGDHVPAPEADDLGIVNHCYADDEFEDEVAEFVDTLASKPPLSVRSIKDCGNVAVNTGLDEGVKYDRRAFSPLLETEDHEEGAGAFFEDYEPEFKGK